MTRLVEFVLGPLVALVMDLMERPVLFAFVTGLGTGLGIGWLVR